MVTTTTSGNRSQRRIAPRFSLRTLLIATAALGILLAYGGNFVHRVQRQQSAIAAVTAAGGAVLYDYQFGMGKELDQPVAPATIQSYGETTDGRNKRTRVFGEKTFDEIETPPGPAYLRRLLGENAFTNVESVSFFWNDKPLGKLAPSILREFPQLKIVALRDSQVRDEWLAQLQNVPKLRTLSLSAGSEGTATSTALGRLGKNLYLTDLSFYGEWPQDETFAGVAQLKRLKSLGMARTPNVTSACFDHLRGLSALEELVLIETAGIDDSGTDALAELKNLRKLWLFRTAISDATLTHLSELSQLRELHLHGTKVTDAGLKSLTELKELRRLWLDETSVGNGGVRDLPKLSLRTLSLGGTNITNECLADIAHMTQLETLELFPNELTDEGLLQLRKLKNLKRLSVGPHITKDAADQLRAALPNCRINRFNEKGGASFPDTP
jgi:Leucine-rich repeat (LRR) protein